MARVLSLPALIGALLFSAGAYAAEATPASSEIPPETASRWAWLGADGGTYWYVPTAFLPAYRWNTDDPAAAASVSDQTVWHIERFENGYFFGPAVAQLDGGSTMCQYMIGSVTPAGRVYIAFNSQPARGTPRITIGTGDMTDTPDGWAFAMQMATGSDTQQVAHWAYMTQCSEHQPCWNSLPGTGSSIPDMLAQCDDD
jgi:hypothetical protein